MNDVIGFDLDKTIHIDHPKYGPEEENWDDPERIADLVPLQPVIDFILAINHPVVFITGRVEATRPHIEKRLREYGIPDPVVVFQPDWVDHEVLRVRKAEAIRKHGVSLYVGDHLSDAIAAEMAGVDFLDAMQLHVLLGMAPMKPGEGGSGYSSKKKA